MLYLEVFLGQFSGWSVPRAFAGFPMVKGISARTSSLGYIYTNCLVSQESIRTSRVPE